MSIEDRVEAFIKAERPSAIAITGGWGEGKTFFWEEVAHKYAPRAASLRKNYAYVSLFGLNSLPELRSALALNIRPVEMIDQDTFAALLGLDSQSRSWIKRVKAAARTILEHRRDRSWWFKAKGKIEGAIGSLAHKATDAGVSVPHVGNLGPFYRAYAYSKVRSALICIDDIERRGANLALKDVLGLISELAIRRGCSVAMIMNDGTLDPHDLAIWQANKEKTFAAELVFTVDAITCAKYVFTKKPLPCEHQWAIESIADLNIKNVRIIERVRDIVDMVFNIVGARVSEHTGRRMVRALTLLTYCHSCGGSQAPPLAMAANRSLGDSNFMPDDVTEGERQRILEWMSQLRTFGWRMSDDLDEVLKVAVEAGFPPIEDLRKTVAKAESVVDRSARYTAIQAAMDRFSNYFDDDLEDVVRQLKTAFLDGLDVISLRNADEIVHLMRELGEHELASHLTKCWIDYWKSNRSALPTKQSLHAVKDVGFRNAVADLTPFILATPVSFDLAWRKCLEEGDPPSQEIRDLLVNESVEGYANFIRANGGTECRRAIDAGYLRGNLLDDAAKEIVCERIRDALLQLSSESRLNRVRFEWEYSKYNIPNPSIFGDAKSTAERTPESGELRPS